MPLAAYLESVEWAKKVRSLLAERGMPLTTFAERAGVNANTLNANMSRGSIPNAFDGAKIATALGVTANWLFNDQLGFDTIELLDRPSSPGDEKIRQVKALVDLLGPNDPGIGEIHRLALLLAREKIGSIDIEPPAHRAQKTA